MIKTIFKLQSIALLSTIVFLMSCQSSAQKSDAADAKVVDAKKDLNAAQKDADIAAQKAAEAEEYRMFKTDTDMKVRSNESLIAEMKADMKTAGKKMDAKYAASVDALEQKNKDMKARLDNYNSNAQTDWASFKREFNHDMDELGKAFKDLTVNNKK